MENLEAALSIYRNVPLDNGDAAIFTDAGMALEVAGLADNWDRLCKENLCSAITGSGVREIAVAIARPDAALLAQDHAMWADMREELAPAGIVVMDPIGLPAAA
jgi:hypothetical protein